MMYIRLYQNFNKRINSTKQPTGGTEVSVVMKENTSVEAPVFLIDGIDLDYNYCLAFAHYYYITDIVVGNNNIFELHCKQDVLATHKSAIGNYTGYVEYCQSEYNNLIADKRLTMSDEISISQQVSSVDIIGTTGSFVVAIAGYDSAKLSFVGMAEYYKISPYQINSLMEWFYSHDISAALKKFFANPYESMISCHWVPWDIDITGMTNSDIVFGDKSSGIQGTGLRQYTYKVPSQVTIDIPWVYHDWRDFEPYSRLELYLPLYGSINLDTSKLQGFDSISVSYFLDPIAGGVTYTLNAYYLDETSTSHSLFIGKYETSAIVPLPLSQLQSSKVQGIAQIGGGAVAAGAAVASIASSGGATTPAVLSLLGGIGAIGTGAVTSFKEDSSYKGSVGSFASGLSVIKGFYGYMRKMTLTMYSHEFGVDNPSDISTIEGRPLFATRTINTLSGYVKCAGASIGVAGLGNDKEELNRWLNSGFYYE